MPLSLRSWPLLALNKLALVPTVLDRVSVILLALKESRVPQVLVVLLDFHIGGRDLKSSELLFVIERDRGS